MGPIKQIHVARAPSTAAAFGDLRWNRFFWPLWARLFWLSLGTLGDDRFVFKAYTQPFCQQGQLSVKTCSFAREHNTMKEE